LRLLPEIYKLEDVDVLRAIHEGLKTVATVEELRQIYAMDGERPQGWCSVWGQAMRQVIVCSGEDGYWVAECPTLRGCIRQGVDEFVSLLK
jgi:hypothetical protein